ncbi:Predicted protein [Taphrina deformans PYCC 5710]|uniref:Cytochrome b561 domain-containing protein n=1 Tax=Taphrina deformans (strain PYCC 5710 / ATCC 11124 / CBS 356.35 / IMI 108563 / JCM 9778 / NBRC 8474) TaxID=1097556 RepID=R4X8M8_TAPDE|nr:Predicted protein [Taphrina deformans PYCC 5710]|eukprot:CCG81725.1 Predicted protein [Taphrina deformans PYCC 5710]
MSSSSSREETETLLPRDTPVLQSPDAPLRLNIISGTAVLAQAGIWLTLLTVWYLTFSTPLILASYHPLANTVALVLLVNAILVLQPTQTGPQKREGAVAHSVLNGLALLSFVAAVVIIWSNKHVHGAPHFTSVHGKVGLVAAVLLGLQVLVGLVQYYLPNLLGGEARAKGLYKWHRLAGYLLTALVLVNVTLGTQTPYFLGKLNRLWVWIVFDVLIVAGLVPRIRPNKMKLL